MLSPAGLKQRSDFIQSLRLFFRKRDYIEVDTPIRLPVFLPEAEIFPYASENWWLQTSPELSMKRLLARGVSRIFQVCHCFRREESGRLHASEFTLLEWYHVGWDYQDLMRECEELVRTLASVCRELPGIVNGDTLLYHGRKIFFSVPWQRMSVEEAFAAFTGTTPVQALKDECFDELLVTEIEPHLGWERPLFLYDYPVQLASLARKKSAAPHLAERFELYCCGIELANGFSELVDPEQQRIRFLHELAGMQRQGRKGEMPELFLRDLAQVSDAAGIALGVDRLLMLFLQADRLADVLPFAEE